MFPRPHRFVLIFLLTVLSFVPASAQSYDAQIAEIDAYAQKALQDWHVPGFALAIVKDDQVIFAKGYGVRELGKPEKVDDGTLFAIASNSKAFTAAAIGLLVDEGKVNWDDPVTKYLPWFQMPDAYVTREMTVRDLLSHRSGFATFSGDLLWYETTYPRDEIIRRIRYLKPAYSFRSHYGYQNLMFLTAGEIVKAVTGKSWDAFVKERFFTPLRMTRTVTTIRELPRGGNIATPHNEVDGKMRVIRYGNVDGGGGAAAINSSVSDMAQWIRMHLAGGKYDGKEILKAETARELQQPNTIIQISPGGERAIPSRHFNAYGMGFFLNDYQGRKMVQHSGGLDGMISQVGMLPEEHLGVVILSNSETGVPSIMMYKTFDVFLGVTPKRDWSAEGLMRSAAGQKAAADERAKIEAARVLGTKPSLALERYVGTYRGTLYGDVKVSMENGHLVLSLVPAPNFVGDMEHWQYDTFRVKWRDTVVYPFAQRGWVTFTLDKDGKLDQLKIDDPNPDFDFTELELHRVP
jgi:CubicO group peptidase (beta-lactamase class C family)